MSNARVLVVGSANYDMTIQTDRLPSVGETVLGGRFIKALGGKGANQAVAAARLGAEVTFVCRLGEDAFGETCFQSYEAEGIFLEYVVWDRKASTGVALIMIDARGRNYLSVDSGANMNLTPDDVERAREAFVHNADILLLQLEVSDAVNLTAARIAKSFGARVILNPAPFHPIPDELLPLIDIITPNQVELAGLMENAGFENEKDLLQYIPNVVMTLGENGARILNATGVTEIPPCRVQAVDTTGAGDAFNGALAVSLAQGKTLEEAVAYANQAGALTVTRLGAQPSLPTLEELQAFRRSLEEVNKA
jgi:ribokinase